MCFFDAWAIVMACRPYDHGGSHAEKVHDVGDGAVLLSSPLGLSGLERGRIRHHGRRT